MLDAVKPDLDYHALNAMLIRALTAVSEMSAIEAVPSIRRGNDAAHAVGLGQMNLHGFLARERIPYGSPEAIEFTSVYFAAVAYHCLRASNALARERGQRFAGFEDSSYADGTFFEKYTSRDWLPRSPRVQALFANHPLPGRADWEALREAVRIDGLYNRYLQAVPPTGSISYINHATASIHPIVSKIEIRKEGKIGRVYYPAPYMTNDNLDFYRDAYEIGPEAIIDTYAAATLWRGVRSLLAQSGGRGQNETNWQGAERRPGRLARGMGAVPRRRRLRLARCPACRDRGGQPDCRGLCDPVADHLGEE